MADKTKPNITFSKYELDSMPGNPDILRALADWHDLQATEADGIGDAYCSQFHTARQQELTTEAERIEKEWVDG